MALIYDSSHSGQEIDAAVDAVQTTIPSQLTQIGLKLGDLANLQTSAKNNVVAAVNEINGKVGSIASGKYYGYYGSASALPTSGNEDGYAYVGATAPYSIYNGTASGGRLTWTDSGAKISSASVADEEDITQDSNGKLSLKDRGATDGMGYIILRSNKTFASQVTKADTVYEIRYDFDLDGASVTIPSGCTLKFDGGSLINGTVVLSNTAIDNNKDAYILKNVTLAGTIKNDRINALWFGAVCDGQTNNDSAFSNLLTSCHNTSATLYIPHNNNYYIFTSPIVIDGTYNIDVCGKLKYNGGGGVETAITIGNTAYRTTGLNLVHIYYLMQGNLPTVNGENSVVENVGLRLINVANCNDINIGNVTYFTYNVIIEANDSHGSCYNRYNIGLLAYGYKQLTLISKNSGWVNENLFIGGHYSTASNSKYKGFDRGICITSSSSYPNNGNQFIKPCVEGNAIGVEIEWGNNNSFMYVRDEGVETPIIEANRSSANRYGNYKASSLLTSEYAKASSAILKNCIFDTGRIGWVKSSTPNTGYYLSLPKVLMGSTLARWMSLTYFNIDEDGYLYRADNGGSNLYILGVDVSVAKTLLISVDAKTVSRRSYRLYDENGNILNEDADLVKNHTTNTHYISGNDVIERSDLKEKNIIVTFGDIVKKVDIRVSVNYNCRIRRIAIYSELPIEVEQNKDCNIYAPYIPVQSSEEITTVINGASNSRTNSWKKINGEWYADLTEGTTSERPVYVRGCEGKTYFDTTLGRQIICKTGATRTTSTITINEDITGSGEVSVTVGLYYPTTTRRTVSITIEFPSSGVLTSAELAAIIAEKLYLNGYIASAADSTITIINRGYGEITPTIDITATYNTDSNVDCTVNQTATMGSPTIWVEQDGEVAGIKRSGTSAERPTPTNVGFMYFDTTLGKMIVWNGTAWVNIDGTSLSSTTA